MVGFRITVQQWGEERILQTQGSEVALKGRGGEPSSPMTPSSEVLHWPAKSSFIGVHMKSSEPEGGLHFIDEETEAPRGYLSYSRSHS